MTLLSAISLVIILSTNLMLTVYTIDINIDKQCCQNKHGNAREVLEWICFFYIQNMTSQDAVDLKYRGNLLADYNNNMVKCARNSTYLKTNLCFSWYFTVPETGIDLCENRLIQYCYGGYLFQCENKTRDRDVNTVT